MKLEPFPLIKVILCGISAICLAGCASSLSRKESLPDGLKSHSLSIDGEDVAFVHAKRPVDQIAPDAVVVSGDGIHVSKRNSVRYPVGNIFPLFEQCSVIAIRAEDKDTLVFDFDYFELVTRFRNAAPVPVELVILLDRKPITYRQLETLAGTIHGKNVGEGLAKDDPRVRRYHEGLVRYLVENGEPKEPEDRWLQDECEAGSTSFYRAALVKCLSYHLPVRWMHRRAAFPDMN